MTRPPAETHPPDFMFRLTKAEKQELVTNCDRLDRLKHSSALPRVFTEQGVAMFTPLNVYPVECEAYSTGAQPV